MLDALKNIKGIPDSSPDQVLPVVLKQIKSLTPQEQQRLAKLALNYNAATKALLGAIFQKIGVKTMLDQLSKSLNELKKEKYEELKHDIRFAPQWTAEVMAKALHTIMGYLDFYNLGDTDK